MAQQGLDAAFQVLVSELLKPAYPDLYVFPCGGKDGGIDGIQDGQSSRVVLECKVVGQDELQTARSRWKEVRTRLEKHLADPSGPTKGQSQYGPWYRSDRPIAEYIFAVSCDLSNLNARDTLEKEIGDFFRGLVGQHAHLAHLRTLTVEVLDWNQLQQRLETSPHLVFRWFPKTRPLGLLPLDEAVFQGTLRSYLDSANLPYYSRAAHRQKHACPVESPISDEGELLRLLEEPEKTGLIICGAGGVGKTRLAIEIGWLARERDWLVLRVGSTFRQEGLDQLAERLAPENRVLLLMDYVETRGGFTEIVDRINDLNATLLLRLRYVATCRTSYYYKAAATVAQHERVDVSAADAGTAAEWLKGYRQAAVRHILSHGGLVVSDQHLKVCSDKPILAVFLSYLKAAGRNDDLEELLGEEDFGMWVIKRVQMSFGRPPIDRDLAFLAAMFPMSAEAESRLTAPPGRTLFDKLASDGWIEPAGPEEQTQGIAWGAVHDVLADQITLTYCRSIPRTVESFVRGLLAQARALGCLRSALTALQRLGGEVEFGNVRWYAVLNDEMAEAPDEYREVRDLVMGTSLLSPVETVLLLGEHEGVFRGDEGDVTFQNRLGWLCRCAVVEHPETVNEAVPPILKSWVLRAVPHPSRSNFVLTWSLRLFPEVVREHALRWIRRNPTVHQTHFLIAAWLKTGLDIEEMEQPVLQWAEMFPEDFHLSFVLCAWLDAGGAPALVQDYIASWLCHQGTGRDTQFVYVAWLKAGGDKALVQDAIKAWLKDHAGTPEAQFVYAAWLKAGGDKALVQGGIEAWMNEHAAEEEAGFVYTAWLRAGGDKALVQDAIKAWLKDHAATPEAQFVYRAWLDAGGDKTLVQGGIKAWLNDQSATPEASFIYRGWLDAGGDVDLVQAGINAWLNDHAATLDAQFVYRAWLKAGGDKALVQDVIKSWLNEHAAEVEAGFIYRAWLDAGGDKGLVQPGIEAWLNKHAAEEEADFVFMAWLSAGGDFSLIRESACLWLREHCRCQEAVYVTKFLAKQRDLPADTVRDILTWCRTFPSNEDALWRMSNLKNHLQREEVAEEVCAAAEQVILARQRCREPLTQTANGQVAAILCWLSNAPHFLTEPLADRVDKILVSWLRHPASYGAHMQSFPNMERKDYVQRIVNLVTSKQLDPVADRACLERFFLWVNAWEPGWKAELRRMFDWLKHHYPDPTLWETVEFE